MITNCELPLQLLLTENTKLNDFDFVLFHLYQTSEPYREYYKKLRKEHPERLMILDNSAYEYYVKGEKLDMNAFMDAIYELMPDYYILPDVLRDKEATLYGVREFYVRYGLMVSDGRSIVRPMAVPQGIDSDELVDCIQAFRELRIDCLGIPFHLPFYTEGHIDEDILNEFGSVYGEMTEDIRYAMGRVQWVRDHDVLLKKFHHIHFLGSHCPLEKLFYSDYNSMDTGYPVKLGVMGVELGDEHKKPDIIIDDFLDKEFSQKQLECIRGNVIKFKNL